MDLHGNTRLATFVEHGAQQGSAVYWIFPEERGWQETRNHKDLAGPLVPELN